MELIIDFDGIHEQSKKEFLIRTLKLLNVKYKTSEKPQTKDEYNQELERADSEIEKNNYTTMDDLLKEMEQW